MNRRHAAYEAAALTELSYPARGGGMMEHAGGRRKAKGRLKKCGYSGQALT